MWRKWNSVVWQSAYELTAVSYGLHRISLLDCKFILRRYNINNKHKFTVTRNLRDRKVCFVTFNLYFIGLLAGFTTRNSYTKWDVEGKVRFLQFWVVVSWVVTRLFMYLPEESTFLCPEDGGGRFAWNVPNLQQAKGIINQNIATRIFIARILDVVLLQIISKLLSKQASLSVEKFFISKMTYKQASLSPAAAAAAIIIVY